MGKCNAENGGCWFCHTGDDKDGFVFSYEFDAWYHPSCMFEALKDDSNIEAKIIKREYDYEVN